MICLARHGRWGRSHRGTRLVRLLVIARNAVVCVRRRSWCVLLELGDILHGRLHPLRISMTWRNARLGWVLLEMQGCVRRLSMGELPLRGRPSPHIRMGVRGLLSSVRWRIHAFVDTSGGRVGLWGDGVGIWVVVLSHVRLLPRSSSVVRWIDVRGHIPCRLCWSSILALLVLLTRGRFV